MLKRLRQFFRFPGGIHLAHRKEASSEKAITQLPLPEKLILPLRQSAGATPVPIVKAGDKVKKGQRIAAAEGWISASLHAPTSGTVRDVGDYPVAHPSGLAAPSIVIEADGEDAWGERQPFLEQTATEYARQVFNPERVQHYLQDMGVVGMGGAVFPSHVKLVKAPGIPLETLIVNGAECEPFVTCDDRLMRERADEIISGLIFLTELLGVREALIAIENNKPEAAVAMQNALAARLESVVHHIRVVIIPAIYPAGSLKQLVYMLTGKRAPIGVLPTQLGVQCFNVATIHAIWRAVAHGEPLIRRIVTVTGDVERPGNLEVPLGASIADILRYAGMRGSADGCLVGGPMMGFLLPHGDAPIGKGIHCLIARSPQLFPPEAPESPCIRCTSCAEACPQGLLPYELYWWSRAGDFAKTQRYHIHECIECGCCAYVCPASIPLPQYFRFAKDQLRAAAKNQEMADQARERFEFRQFRIEREKAERAEKLAQAARAQSAKRAVEQAGASSAPPTSEAEAIIAAAVERTRMAHEAETIDPKPEPGNPA
ncbi:MAG: electron transport complex subunit RsxC [Zoogloeaceae bacterium]|jgi:electron transport complex protein RnfC|nr:electron transport complex subunit RsxC [Zoogloeaceae bacterium]